MTDDPCICTGLRRAAHAVSQAYDAALAPVGLKVTMYRLLKTVACLERPNITGLAAAMDLDRSTLGRNLRVLERDGLVRLRGGEDGRATLIEPTEKGSATLRAAVPLWAEAQAAIKAKLGPDRAVLLDLLDRVQAPAA